MTLFCREGREKHMKNNWKWKLLFSIYFILLVWIIMFKLEFSVEHLVSVRRANFKPFYYATGYPSFYLLMETIANVIIFIPFGIFLVKCSNRFTFIRFFLVCACTSISFELIQYVLAIGRFDITDVITNTLGGTIGICLAGLFRKK